MTDVNERAAALAEENAARGGVKATVRRGSFYEPVDEEKFDVIVTNPPISAGMARVVEPMISGAPAHLKSGGSLQLVVQSNKGGRTVEGLLGESFGSIEVLARGGGYRVFRATA
jgi:16S rRNA (guanine1207-N2)-methyltransferase